MALTPSPLHVLRMCLLCAVLESFPSEVITFSICTEQENVAFSIENKITTATIALGCLSFLVCTCVVLVILAYRKDMIFLRDRIILGLMSANIVFSVANIAPVKYFQNCTPVISATGSAWIRGVWLLGKYWMVCYEIMIVATALIALRAGQASLSRTVEACCHVTCFAVGVTAFVVWSTLVMSDAAKHQVLSANFNECVLSTDDEAALHSCSKDRGATKEQFTIVINHIAHVLTVMVRVWLGPFALSLLLWVLSRVQYHALLRAWMTEHSAAVEGWSKDFWGLSVRQERVLVLRREAFDEIARPLEPYIAVFFVFGIPAVVMSMDFCQHISTQQDKFCQRPCEMILALRSAATGLVYFWRREHRQQLWHFGELWSRLCQRICPFMCMRGGSEARGEGATGASCRRWHRKHKHVAFATELDLRLIGENGVPQQHM
eukprot:m.1023388 g.1023388  ORF g.1023388 m.1023388 type:complete len:434 (+) comp24097_c0_seq2:257-1558(+)